jgi:hypothetical protein
MEGTFGARLRAERERREITLGAISNDTKIKLSLLEAIERDEVSKLPLGLFRRSYVRAYARAIGLDADEIVREFIALYPDPADFSTEPPLPEPASRFGRAVASAFGSLPVRRPHVPARTEPTPEVQAEPAAPALPPAIAEPPQAVVDAPAAAAPAPVELELDLLAVADVCTRLARASTWDDVEPLLAEATALVHALGMSLWLWDPRLGSLQPAWAYGYPDSTLARMPRVRRDADNAIAAAFRTGGPRIVDGTDSATGALVVPVVTPCGCAGVLALEMKDGGEQREAIRAVAIIVAAQLAALIGTATVAEAVTA